MQIVFFQRNRVQTFQAGNAALAGFPAEIDGVVQFAVAVVAAGKRLTFVTDFAGRQLVFGRMYALDGIDFEFGIDGADAAVGIFSAPPDACRPPRNNFACR